MAAEHLTQSNKERRKRYAKTQSAVDAINRTSVSYNNAYTATNLNIKAYDEETKNVISNTFGVLKHDFNASWNAIGFEPNVNIAYEQTIMNGENSFEMDGKIYYQHSGVGNLKAYNEIGNPSGGCFTMHTIA